MNCDFEISTVDCTYGAHSAGHKQDNVLFIFKLITNSEVIRCSNKYLLQILEYASKYEI